MELLSILILIGIVLAVLAAGRFRHPPSTFPEMSEEEADHWKSMAGGHPLPAVRGRVAVMGEDEKAEVDHVVIPDLWFYRRKDRAFQEARSWLDEDGKVWWREFEPSNAKGMVRVAGVVAAGEYVETVEVRGRRRKRRRALYLETVAVVDEMCRAAGFVFEKEEGGWRCYRLERLA
jgi:hypothetical protein